MIFGLTHDADTGVMRDMTQYFGKISTGYGPGEGPNRSNHPIQCGFYRILVQRQIRVPQSGGKTAIIDKWVENQAVHEKVGKEPTSLKFICDGRRPADIWQSRLTYWATGRIKCSGDGHKATFYEDMGDGTVKSSEVKCPYLECQYFKSGNCKPEGRLKVGLVDDYHLTSMYRLDTKSINSILSIETSLNQIYETLERLHIMSRAPMKEFYEKGMHGMMLRMSLRQKKSGKNTVWITYIEIPQETEKILTDALIAAMGKQSMISIGKDSPDVLKIEESPILSGDHEAVVTDEPVTPTEGAGPEVQKLFNPVETKFPESVGIDNKAEIKPEEKPGPANDAASVLAKMQPGKPAGSPISFSGVE